MQIKDIIHITRCFSGRCWINIGGGLFAIGFRNYKIERLFIFRELRFSR